MTTAYETLGRLNPFRYRGYVYDEETELYYLRSRYYTPTWERFVNADSRISPLTINSANVYSYCKNTPVVHTDTSGLDRYYAVLNVYTDQSVKPLAILIYAFFLKTFLPRLLLSYITIKNIRLMEVSICPTAAIQMALALSQYMQ